MPVLVSLEVNTKRSGLAADPADLASQRLADRAAFADAGWMRQNQDILALGSVVSHHCEAMTKDGHEWLRVIGTTDVQAPDPDDQSILQDEIDAMLEDGERLVPGFKQVRALRVWAGVRPLFEDRKESGSTCDVTRAHALLDHGERDGVQGFLTVTGGKMTTYRLMAEETVNAVCRQLGEERPCTTAKEPLPGSESGKHYQLSERLRRKEEHLLDSQLVCECELITRDKLEQAFRRRGTTDLDDIRRGLRLGMGPCQGGFCMYRATGILHALDGVDASHADAALLDFLAERWKGIWPVLYGDQLRQARLDEWIFQGVLDVEHLPS